MPTGIWYDERCLIHDNGSMIVDERAKGWLQVTHAENPERIARAVAVLEASGVAREIDWFPLREATEGELMLVHSRAHIERIRAGCASDTPVFVGPEARAARGSWNPALLSAGGAVAAVDWVLDDAGRNAYVSARPPGHHASSETAMGFCLLQQCGHRRPPCPTPASPLADGDRGLGSFTTAMEPKTSSTMTHLCSTSRCIRTGCIRGPRARAAHRHRIRRGDDRQYPTSVGHG